VSWEAKHVSATTFPGKRKTKFEEISKFTNHSTTMSSSVLGRYTGK
jgi:hypothetical protein